MDAKLLRGDIRGKRGFWLNRLDARFLLKAGQGEQTPLGEQRGRRNVIRY